MTVVSCHVRWAVGEAEVVCRQRMQSLSSVRLCSLAMEIFWGFRRKDPKDCGG